MALDIPPPKQHGLFLEISLAREPRLNNELRIFCIKIVKRGRPSLESMLDVLNHNPFVEVEEYLRKRGVAEMRIVTLEGSVPTVVILQYAFIVHALFAAYQETPPRIAYREAGGDTYYFAGRTEPGNPKSISASSIEVVQHL